MIDVDDVEKDDSMKEINYDEIKSENSKKNDIARILTRQGERLCR